MIESEENDRAAQLRKAREELKAAKAVIESLTRICRAQRTQIRGLEWSLSTLTNGLRGKRRGMNA